MKNLSDCSRSDYGQLLRAVLPSNEFYRGKFAGVEFERIDSLKQLRSCLSRRRASWSKTNSASSLWHRPDLPIGKLHPHSPNLGHDGKTDVLARYRRVVELVGASAGRSSLKRPAFGPGDRIFFAFSFGPFIGFWAGWEGARKLGALAISGGAQSTAQRLKSIVDYGATVLVCTPTYALHMASEARKAGMDLAKDSAIKITIHAGEPGASIPSTKKLIEESWGAKCYDHAGATEVGAFGFRVSNPTRRHPRQRK